MADLQSTVKFLCCKISPVAVNTTVAETSLFDQIIGLTTLPANFLSAGTVIRLRGKGIFSSSGATTKIFKVKIGATVFTFGTYTASGALANRPFTLDWQGSLQLAGAAGTMWGNGECTIYEVAGAAPLSVTMTGTAATAIDTTVANLLALTKTEGTSSATDGTTLHQLTCEVMQ